MRATPEVDYRGCQGLVTHSELFRSLLLRHLTPCRASAMPSAVVVAVALGSAWVPNFSLPAPPRTSPVTALEAATPPVWSLTAVTLRTPGPPPVPRGVSLSEGGRAVVGNGCPGRVTGHVKGGLVKGDKVCRVCGVIDRGGACTDLADGDHGGGWDCLVGEGSIGRDSDISGRTVGGKAGASCSDCGGGCGSVGCLPPGLGCRLADVGIRG